MLWHMERCSYHLAGFGPVLVAEAGAGLTAKRFQSQGRHARMRTHMCTRMP